jgi:signal transduction histidine kinase/CheY-like chemotaxis protein
VRSPPKEQWKAVGDQLRSNVARELSGLLVAGVSARLRLDDLYRSFFELVGAQIATAIANARAYEQERRRAEALAEIDRAKTAFFSNVSREFRTPLTLMLGPLEDLLAAPAEALLERRDDLALVHRSGLRLLRLVNTLLDFSRIEAGRIQASYEPVDLQAFTRELASVFRSATDRAGLRLTIDCAALGELVWVDRDMWEKIVLNLLSNAFKFTCEGGITLRMRRENGSAVLLVEDTGTGIPEHEIPRLFERFHRVEGARGRTHEGTGIGLALVQELTKLHGGTVRAQSVLGEGSTFTVTIPLGSAHLPSDQTQAEQTLVSTALGAQPYIMEALRWLPEEDGSYGAESGVERVLLPEQPVLASSSSHAARATILFADDNADMRDYIRRLLSARYDVRTSADGEEALAELRASRPDLLLSDVMMPRLDGFELLRAVRGDPALSNLPVIFLSARAGEEASVEGLEAGADDYLIKPFSARELLARVRANLEMARIRREAERRVAADLQAMTRLREVGERCIRAGNDFHGCLEDILDTAIAITEADKGNIQLLNIEAGTLEIAAQRGFRRPFLNFFDNVAEGEAAACGIALQSAGRVIAEDVTKSEIFAGQRSLDVLLEAGVRAVQSTPLISSAGTVFGMISTHFSHPHRPSERDLRLIDLLAQQAADYLERKKAVRRYANGATSSNARSRSAHERSKKKWRSARKSRRCCTRRSAWRRLAN